MKVKDRWVVDITMIIGLVMMLIGLVMTFQHAYSIMYIGGGLCLFLAGLNWKLPEDER